jgi:phenylpropionate dioxygenase-like ring-hydroxylating dioxygenase large terminal subunit
MTYLMNAWYPAAFSREVTRDPMRRRLLDRPTVFYRKGDGSPVALLDRCPHRLVPLSRGKIVGDDIVCGYHGLRFDETGACIHNPHSSKIPAAARVDAFPLVERYGLVWIWPGEASRADPALLPPFAPFDTNPDFVVVDGYLHVAANYQLVTDNLLDLSHVEFLHPDFAIDNAAEVTRTELIEDGNAIQINRWKPACTVSRFLRTFWKSQAPVGDARANIRWHAPASLFLDLGVTEVNSPVDEGVSVPFLHLLTPETASTTHYFWAMARDCDLADEALSERVRQTAARVFETEDEPMIEAQQLEIGTDKDLMDLSPALLPPDAPAMKARRALARMIESEG